MKKPLLIIGIFFLIAVVLTCEICDPQTPGIESETANQQSALSQSDIIYSGRSAVRRSLKVPSSAQFPPWPDGSYDIVDLGNYSYIASGEVTAKNAFGVMVRVTWQVRLKFSGPGHETVNVSEVILDGKIVYNAP